MTNGQNATNESGQIPDPESLKQLFPEDSIGMAKLCISMLFGTAWQYLGMAMHPKKGIVVKDLAQAKLAIDCGTALLELIQKLLPEAEAREFNRVLSDLKMNFVSQSQS